MRNDKVISYKGLFIVKSVISAQDEPRMSSKFKDCLVSLLLHPFFFGYVSTRNFLANHLSIHFKPYELDQGSCARFSDWDSISKWMFEGTSTLCCLVFDQNTNGFKGLSTIWNSSLCESILFSCSDCSVVSVIHPKLLALVTIVSSPYPHVLAWEILKLTDPEAEHYGD